jgi:hypothetical protein
MRSLTPRLSAYADDTTSDIDVNQETRPEARRRLPALPVRRQVRCHHLRPLQRQFMVLALSSLRRLQSR